MVGGLSWEATRLSRASVEEARAGHTNTISCAYAYGACAIAELCGDWAALEQLADTLVGFAEEHALELWRTFGLAYRGSALVGRGAVDAGIALQQKARAGLTSIRSALRLPAQLGVLARALGQAGHHDEAMAVIESAIEQARLSEERWCWPELLRIKGEVLLWAEEQVPPTQWSGCSNKRWSRVAANGQCRGNYALRRVSRGSGGRRQSTMTPQPRLPRSMPALTRASPLPASWRPRPCSRRQRAGARRRLGDFRGGRRGKAMLESGHY
jgi:hypothetical protein